MCQHPASDREPFATPQISGVFRIVMKPLIDDIPVVAGMVVAMKAPPQACFCFVCMFIASNIWTLEPPEASWSSRQALLRRRVI